MANQVLMSLMNIRRYSGKAVFRVVILLNFIAVLYIGTMYLKVIKCAALCIICYYFRAIFSNFDRNFNNVTKLS